MGETTGSVVLVVSGWLVGWLGGVGGWLVVGSDEFIVCVNLNGNILQSLEGFNDMPAAFLVEKRSQILKAVKPTPQWSCHEKISDTNLCHTVTLKIFWTTKPKPQVTGYGCRPKANPSQKNMSLKAKAPNDKNLDESFNSFFRCSFPTLVGLNSSVSWQKNRLDWWFLLVALWSDYCRWWFRNPTVPAVEGLCFCLFTVDFS